MILRDNFQEKRCKRCIDGVQCPNIFNGPPARKYCDDHSNSIKVKGRRSFDRQVFGELTEHKYLKWSRR